ncbi:MAG: BrnT family toxin [Rhodobacteraceae bacterium]|nr:BrnT family toxin [Paracoccaceae bacterium]
MTKFEWDPAKAASNLRKHGISFEMAATVLQDQFARSVEDEFHGSREERWITMGLSRNGKLLVVSHTFFESDNGVLVRIISARPATSAERRQYEVGN